MTDEELKKLRELFIAQAEARAIIDEALSRGAEAAAWEKKACAAEAMRQTFGKDEGFALALEQAAQWHVGRAAATDQRAKQCDWGSGDEHDQMVVESAHTLAARAIRALQPDPSLLVVRREDLSKVQTVIHAASGVGVDRCAECHSHAWGDEGRAHAADCETHAAEVLLDAMLGGPMP